ncbi:hypothetical protein M569_09601 [Genlisea aurea]|uniref:Calmodulin-binding domain-containing protein n=1 Tax=Genlisea aurea TaxID=192259 RepID=S8CEA2_9LAMI|nr:hypothetical protein M569_09601 [Genlisea aurea]
MSSKNSLVSSNSELQTANSVDLSKQKPVSLWNTIYQHMSSSSADESPESDFETSNESKAQDMEVKKVAVRMVRDAIEKILLPEVQDVTNNHSNEAEAKKEESHVAAETREKTAPKNWSNLKKWILLQRFTRELEKVRKFNLKASQESEPEKIIALKQTTDGKKNSEEWMLDYALRQAVNQLAPTQKRKVALLVQAFEMVVPPSSNEKSELDHSHHSTRIEESVAVDESKQEVNFLEVETEKFDESIAVDGNVKEADEEDAVPGPVNLEPIQLSEDAVENHQGEPDPTTAGQKTEEEEEEGSNHLEMWHMIYQHVVTSLAEKIGSKLLDNVEESESSKLGGGLTKSAVVHLIKVTVDEILLSKTDSESATTTPKAERPKSKNWAKLKKLLLVRRSIKALEAAKKNETSKQQRRDISRGDERKKAEEWMLDYAVQHIVNKLTPARKQRVSLLVEAFEAVVPFPEI